MDINSLSSLNPSLIRQQRELSNANTIASKLNNSSNKKDDKLYKVSLEFESLIVKQMLNVMKKTINKTGLMDGGMGEEYFGDMLYDEYAKDMSKNSKFGLADAVYNELTRISSIKAESLDKKNINS